MTTLEFKVLKAWLLVAKDNCGARNKKELLIDNFSWATPKDILEIDNSLNLKQVSGIFGDFSKKEGVGYDLDSEDNGVWFLFDSLVERLPDKDFVDLREEDFKDFKF